MSSSIERIPRGFLSEKGGRKEMRRGGGEVCFSLRIVVNVAEGVECRKRLSGIRG